MAAAGEAGTWILGSGEPWSRLRFLADVESQVAALLSRGDDKGRPCGAASSLPRFSGPGRTGDPCPLATLVLRVQARTDEAPP